MANHLGDGTVIVFRSRYLSSHQDPQYCKFCCQPLIFQLVVDGLSEKCALKIFISTVTFFIFSPPIYRFCLVMIIVFRKLSAQNDPLCQPPYSPPTINIHRIWTGPVIYEIITKRMSDEQPRDRSSSMELRGPLIQGKEFEFVGIAGGTMGVSSKHLLISVRGFSNCFYTFCTGLSKNCLLKVFCVSWRYLNYRSDN